MSGMGVDLLNLSNKIIMLLWLLDYDISHYPLDIFLTMKYYDIPFPFFFWKYVSRSKLTNIPIDKIYDNLFDMNIIDTNNFDDDIKTLLEIINIIDKHKGLIPASQITQKLIDQLGVIVPYVTNETIMEKIHTGQPIPDPEKGRPYIDWKQCKYFGCNKSFDNANELIKHLVKYSCYIERFHWHHEAIVKSKNLTPEKVIENNMISCPSIICSKYKFKSSGDLINHFIELGIEPFWEKGMVILPNNPFTSFTSTEIKKINVYNSDECLVCLSDKPKLVNLPCMHKIYCIGCWIEGKFNKCAVCTFKVDKVIPCG